ncbi:MAG: FliM/FliN family flagellar motor switch protein [Bacillota bacterium]
MMNQSEIEAMFEALHQPDKITVAPVKFQVLKPVESLSKSAKGIEHLGEIELTIDAELGSTQMTVREVLDLDTGMVVALDCLAGEPVNINLNGVPFAKGEVVVINDNFGTRINELLTEDTR